MLDQARDYLWESDDEGTYEAALAIDMFRAALDEDLSTDERAARLIHMMDWCADLQAEDDRLSPRIRRAAAKIRDAAGRLNGR